MFTNIKILLFLVILSQAIVVNNLKASIIINILIL